MDPKHIQVDQRLIDTGCVYCGCPLVEATNLECRRGGGSPASFEDAMPQQRTRDHVPSRAFLDHPFPQNLPVVECCRKCNNELSLDEQYLACLLECVACGSVEPQRFERERVASMLRDSPMLRERLAATMRASDSGTTWEMETERVRHVISKLTRGHAAFEHQRRYPGPDSTLIMPLMLMSDDERIQFERGSAGHRVLPEVGSRALTRAVLETRTSGWVDVQPKRYRYTSTIYADGLSVRLVIRDYLACEAWWKDLD
nr:hypothetical protein GCM10023233_30540 [Brevibacterium otitidis]